MSIYVSTLNLIFDIHIKDNHDFYLFIYFKLLLRSFVLSHKVYMKSILIYTNAKNFVNFAFFVWQKF